MSAINKIAIPLRCRAGSFMPAPAVLFLLLLLTLNPAPAYSQQGWGQGAWYCNLCSGGGTIAGPLSVCVTDDAAFRVGNAACATVQFSVDTNGANAGVYLPQLTAGSVLFIGTGGLISQDNAALFFNNTTDDLGIGTATPSTPLEFDLNTSCGADPCEIIRMNTNEGVNTNASIYLHDTGEIQIVSGAAIIQLGLDGAGSATDYNIRSASSTGGGGDGGDLTLSCGTGNGAGVRGTLILQDWRIDASGDLLTTTDAAEDIGAAADNRPNNLFLAGSIDLVSAATIDWNEDLILTREGAAILQLGVDAAAPVTQTIAAPDATGGGPTAGADLWLFSGDGVGGGANGDIELGTVAATIVTINDTAVTTTQEIISPGFWSNAADIADAGTIRLGNAQTIAWEGNAAADRTLTLGADNIFDFSTHLRVGGSILTTNGTVSTGITSQAMSIMTNDNNGTDPSILFASGSHTRAAGTSVITRIAPIIVGSVTAGYTALEVDVTQTSTGSGLNRLAEFQVGNADRVVIANDGDVNNAGFWSTTPQAVTVEDGGVGATNFTFAPTASVVQITCNDADGCVCNAVTETGIPVGGFITVVNISAANTVTMSDVAGALVGTDPVLGANDTVAYVYSDQANDLLIQTGTSNN